MRKFLIILAALVGSSFSAEAAINDFVGTWVNTDPDTGGATKVVVTRVSGGTTVQVFGSCTPTDCDWGAVDAEVYGPSAGENAYATAEAITAVFNPGFSETIVVLIKEGGQLKGKFLTRFTDGSGRASYVNTETFNKEMAGLGGLIGQVLNPGVLLGVPKQDCVGFNNANLQVKDQGGVWRLVDGDHSLKRLGADEEEALKVLAVIQNYGFTEHCFVGRPDPSFDYWLASNAAVAASGAGEDCLGFNNANIEVQEAGGSWKIVDGDHWMFDFGANKAEADETLQLIKFHGFTKTCYVGRPDPSLTYLLK